MDEHYPLVADATFVPMLHGEVLKDSDWASPSLHAVVKFSWAVLLRECASRASFSGVCVCVCVCVYCGNLDISQVISDDIT